MTTRPEDLDAPLSAEEVQLLYQHAPQHVRVTEDGELIPLVTRREVFHLQLRYPTLDPTNVENDAPPASSGGHDEAVLRARYPTMFKGR